MDPATKMTMPADFPGLLTLSELDRLLDTLSASERAAVIWSRPGLAKALDGLLTEPLNHATLEAAARMFVRVTLGLSRIGRKMAKEEVASLAFTAAVSKRRPRLVTFLGSEMVVAHAETAAKAIGASIQGLLPHASPSQTEEQLPYNDQELDALVDSALQGPLRGILFAQVLLGALFDAEDQSASRERGRDLARLALVAAVDGVTALRSHSVTISLADTGRPYEDEDELLAGMANKALRDTSEEAARAGRWVLARMPQRDYRTFATTTPAVEAPRPRTRLLRHVGEVISVRLGKNPGVGIVAAGAPHWFSATPEIVERAWALHGAPVEAMTVQTSGIPGLSAWTRPPGRLVRIDPASGEQAPDSATRSRDMLRDWDELLHRLAR